MQDQIRAVFRDGAFYPSVPCPLPENSEVELIVRPATLASTSKSDPAERRRILQRVTERMRNSPLPIEASRLTREWLHERR